MLRSSPALNEKLQAEPPEADGTRYLDALLPVVEANKFNQTEPIKDFVPFRITSVNLESPKGIYGVVLSLVEMQSALPGGGKVGGLAPPKLVQ